MKDSFKHQIKMYLKRRGKKQEVPSAHKQLGYSSLYTIVRIIYKILVLYSIIY